MSMEQWWVDSDGVNPKYSEKTLSSTLFTTNSTWNGLKSNPSPSGERPGAAAPAGGPAFLDCSILTFVIRIGLFTSYALSVPLFYLVSIK
jgi:hypothetical protein